MAPATLIRQPEVELALQRDGYRAGLFSAAVDDAQMILGTVVS
jgi:hypothetical protein